MKPIQSHDKQRSLVDEVEDRILEFFESQNLELGDSLPKELELVEKLGVARSVIREALSRLRMMGLIETRTKRGMILAEPNIFGGIKRVIDPRYFRPKTLLDLLEFRVSLEIGLSSQIIRLITDDQVDELLEIVSRGLPHDDHAYDLEDEFSFHTKLYEISQNSLINDFQIILHPAMTYVKQYYESELKSVNESLIKSGKMVTHLDLCHALRSKNLYQFREAIEGHFLSYQSFLQNQRAIYLLS